MKSIRKVLTRRVAKAAAVPVAVIVGALCVFGGSSAAFSGWSGSPNSVWAAATVNLENDHASVMFTPNNVAPGYTETRCITLNSVSSIDTVLKFYASQTENTNALGDNLQLRIATGSGGTEAAGGCTGFTEDQVLYNGTATGLNGAAGSPATALQVTKPLVAHGTQQFEITASLPAAVGNAVQGGTFAMDFNWINGS